MGRRPFRVLESRHQLRFVPDAVFHFGSRAGFAPPSFLALRQIGERTFFGVKFLEIPKHRISSRRNEAVTHPRGKDKFFSLVAADQECIKVFRAWGIAGNNKLLPAADAHFHPGATGPAGLIAAPAALRHDTLKALRTHDRYHFLGRDGETL